MISDFKLIILFFKELVTKSTINHHFLMNKVVFCFYR